MPIARRITPSGPRSSDVKMKVMTLSELLSSFWLSLEAWLFNAAPPCITCGNRVFAGPLFDYALGRRTPSWKPEL